MIIKSSRWRLAAAASPLALALSFAGASPASAQTDPAVTDPNAPVQTAQADTTTQPSATAQSDTTVETAQATSNDETIVVTGFRAALQNAVNTKKRAETVVESVSAEDIGKLPDASIAESISRLPGLTSQRLSGRSNVISIRGFSPDFSTTLLNGREQTSTGDNRAVEYDQYPSEIINQVNVYKTPMASLIGQGLSGTVDLRSIRPLDISNRIISVGARGVFNDLDKLNPDVDRYGWRVNGLYADKFADDTVGIALAATYLDEPFQTEEFNSWGYAGTGPGGGAPFVIGGSKSYNTSTNLKRLGLMGTLQFRPTPNFTSTLDAFYSDFKEDAVKRGIELPLYWGGVPLTNAVVTGNLVTSGSFNGVKGVVRNDVFQRHAKLYAFGWNNEWKSDDGWRASADVAYSKTDRNELTLESYSGTGRSGVGALDNISFTSGSEGTSFSNTLDYSDFNTILLTSPQGWGGTQVGSDGTRIVGGQDGYYNNRIIADKLWQARADVTKELETPFISSVQAGANYTNRYKKLVPDEFFLGLAANTSGNVSIPVPEEFRLGVSNTFLG
ncbi:MAG: TonB-dependent receptor, partial [Sphingomonas sp.]|nr:TonB-dependent receptor [Sphingomonas sp.]